MLNDARKSTEPEIRISLNLPKPEKLLNEIFAFPNLVELELNAAAGFGEIPESIKQAQKLRAIEFTGLEDVPVRVELPAIFLELPQVEKYHFSRCSMIHWGDRSWRGLSNLRIFYAYVSGTEFPKGLLDLDNIEELHLYASRYPSIPNEISRLQSLRVLSVDDYSLKSKELPRSITQLKNLESVDLRCNEIPNWIGEFPATLKELSLTPGKQSETIDERIFDYTELTYLRLWRVGITQLSPKIGQLTKLTSLTLYGNKLSSLPREMERLQELESLMLDNNQFVQLPAVVAKLPKLKKLTYNSQSAAHTSELSRFQKFLDWLDAQNLAPAQRAFLADVWDRKEFPSLDLPMLARALTSGISPLDSNALQYLTAWQNPLKSGSVLVLGIDTRLKKTEIKEKLKTAGITLGTKIDAKTTHFLIGEKCKTPAEEWLGKSNISLLSEPQLNEYLNQISPDYLVEDAQQAAATNAEGMSQNVVEMLLSMDSQNIGVALGLLKSGGVPDNCKTPLFCVYKLADDATQRSEAGKLLRKAASPTLLDAMKKKVDFLAKRSMSYATINSMMSVFDETEIDMGLFALQYIRSNPRPADVQYFLMTKGYTEHLLTFWRGRIKEGGLSVDISYNLAGIHNIPPQLMELTELRALKIYLYSQEWTMEGVFLPQWEQMVNLDKLEIHLGGKSWTEVPPVLAKLKKLKYLKINASAPVKESLRAMMPDCEIV